MVDKKKVESSEIQKMMPNAEEVQRELDSATERAANLTRQLLMFSRRSVLEMRHLDLNDVVSNLLKMLGRLLGEHITLSFDRHRPLPMVEADAGNPPREEASVLPCRKAAVIAPAAFEQVIAGLLGICLEVRIDRLTSLLSALELDRTSGLSLTYRRSVDRIAV